MVGFELWRLEDGLIVEHWDSFEPVVAETVSGNSQVDGPSEPGPADGAATKALVEEIVPTILVDNDFARLDDFLAARITSSPTLASATASAGWLPPSRTFRSRASA
jgi:hypothetical protein